MSDYSRILAIDLGEKRVGLAVSDPLGSFAVGLETFELQPNKPQQSKTALLDQIAVYCKQYSVSRIVLGLPVSMDGQEHHAAQKVRDFAESLNAVSDCPTEFVDERLTSVLAHQTLKAQGIKPSRNKGLVDQAAACRILQDYLDKKNRT